MPIKPKHFFSVEKTLYCVDEDNLLWALIPTETVLDRFRGYSTADPPSKWYWAPVSLRTESEVKTKPPEAPYR